MNTHDSEWCVLKFTFFVGILIYCMFALSIELESMIIMWSLSLQLQSSSLTPAPTLLLRM